MVGFHEASAEGNKTEEEHATTEPARRAKLFEKDVRGDFEDAVRDEEHQETVVVLAGGEVEVFLEAEGQRIACGVRLLAFRYEGKPLWQRL